MTGGGGGRPRGCACTSPNDVRVEDLQGAIGHHLDGSTRQEVGVPPLVLQGKLLLRLEWQSKQSEQSKQSKYSQKERDGRPSATHRANEVRSSENSEQVR